MTTKTTKELQAQAQIIINNYGLQVKENDYQQVKLESIYNALQNALYQDTFKRVKKQLRNCLNTIDYAVESEIISLSDYVYTQYTKNFINRGILVASVLAQFENYFKCVGAKMNTHLIDTNNPASVKQFTTRENAITVCDSGIYITKTSDIEFHYDLTTDKNKKIVKKLTNLKNESLECLVAW